MKLILTALGGVIGFGLEVFSFWVSAIVGGMATCYFSKSCSLLSVEYLYLIGIVSGILPANKAAKLDPIDCLRYEIIVDLGER